MGILVDASTLISDIRRTADMENTSFVTDTEIVRYINLAYQWAYMKLGESYEDWNLTAYHFATTAGTREYSVPSDFIRLRKLMYVRDYGTSSEREYPLKRNNWSSTDSTPSYSSVPNRFMLRGSKIRLYPNVNGVHDYYLYYLAAPATLTAASTSVEMQFGMDRFIAYDAALRCLIKEKSDTSEVMAERNNAFNDLLSSIDNRDSSEPMTIQEVEYGSGGDIWEWTW